MCLPSIIRHNQDLININQLILIMKVKNFICESEKNSNIAYLI